MKSVCASMALLLFSLSFILTLAPAQIRGSSMNPTLWEGNMVLTRSPSSTETLTGQIISYRYNSTLSVCHRVIEDRGASLIVKGDNNPSADPLVYRSQIQGVVTVILPIWFSTFMFALISGTATLFVFTSLIAVLKWRKIL